MPYPLARLSPEVDVSGTLARWGLRSIGDLAKLPASEIAARLGRGGEKLHEMARGLDPEPLAVRLPPPVFSEGMELEWPLVTLEPFLAMAGAALDRLLPRLAVEGLGCTRLETALHLEPEGMMSAPSPSRLRRAIRRRCCGFSSSTWSGIHPAPRSSPSPSPSTPTGPAADR